MDDMDGMDRDEWIARLSAEGWSVRRIAAEVQVSKSRLQQILAALNAADEWAEDDGLALLDAEEPEYQAVPPFRFVGIGERGEERFLDGNGESVSVLDIWRADHTEDGGSVGCGYLADRWLRLRPTGMCGCPTASSGIGSWPSPADPDLLPGGCRGHTVGTIWAHFGRSL